VRVLRWWGLTLALACARHPVEDDEALFQSALVRADQAWLARGTDGFDAVSRALGAVPARFENHSEVRWRRARLDVGRGIAASVAVDARRYWAAARDEAEACAMEDAIVRAHRGEGWTAAVQYVGDARLPCLSFGAEGWARWMISFGGVAASVDEEALRAWISASERADAAARVPLLRALLATAQEDPVAASLVSELYRSARSGLDGDLWVRWEDMLRVTQTPPPALSSPPRGPRTPEEAAALARLTATPGAR
jgi:hypothetical protein